MTYLDAAELPGRLELCEAVHPEVEAEAVDLQPAASDPEEVEHLLQRAEAAATRRAVQHRPLAGPMAHDLPANNGSDGVTRGQIRV